MFFKKCEFELSRPMLGVVLKIKISIYLNTLSNYFYCKRDKEIEGEFNIQIFLIFIPFMSGKMPKICRFRYIEDLLKYWNSFLKILCFVIWYNNGDVENVEICSFFLQIPLLSNWNQKVLYDFYMITRANFLQLFK